MNKKAWTWVKLGGAIGIVTGSMGLCIGLSYISTASEYVDLNSNNENKQHSFYDPELIKGTHRVCETLWPTADFKSNNSASSSEAKFKYATQVLDGQNHLILDRSFNENAYRGLAQWIWQNPYNPTEPNIDSDDLIPPTSDYATAEGNFNSNPPKYSANGQKPSSDDPTVFYKTYDALIRHSMDTNAPGSTALVLPGYMHADGLMSYKLQPNSHYKNGGYIVLDANISPNDGHEASVLFKSHESAFLAGLATGMYLNENFNQYYNNGNKHNLAVGTYGGVDISSVAIYMGGFQYGIKVFNQLLQNRDFFNRLRNIVNVADPSHAWPASEYDDNRQAHEIKFINLGKLDSWFTNSFVAGDGKIITDELLQRGADAILPVAGPQTVDTVKEIKAYNSSCIVVGVDTAQETDFSVNNKSSYKDVSGDNCIIKYSAVKNIASITSQILDLAYRGEYNNATKGGPDKYDVGTFGYLTVGDHENNGTGISSNKTIAPNENVAKANLQENNGYHYLFDCINAAYGTHYDWKGTSAVSNYAKVIQWLGGNADPSSLFPTTPFDYWTDVSSESNMVLRI